MRHRRSPLPARRLLARHGGGQQPADVGAARHGGHAPRRRLLRLPLGASLAGHGGGCGPRPSTPGPLPSRHSSRPRRAGRSTDILIECSAVYTLRCTFMARITKDNKRFVLYGFCHRRSAAAEHVDSSSVLKAAFLCGVFATSFALPTLMIRRAAARATPSQ